MTVSTISAELLIFLQSNLIESAELLIFLQSNLIEWYSIISWSVLHKKIDCCFQGQDNNAG